MVAVCLAPQRRSLEQLRTECHTSTTCTVSSRVLVAQFLVRPPRLEWTLRNLLWAELGVWPKLHTAA